VELEKSVIVKRMVPFEIGLASVVFLRSKATNHFK
jgi:hypothetical protein